MGFQQLLGVGGAPVVAAGFSALGVNFDGSTRLARGATPTGLVDGSVGAFSCWLRFADNLLGSTFISNSGGTFSIARASGSNNFAVLLSDAAFTNFYAVLSTAGYSSTSTWYNLLVSWNVNFVSGSRVFQLYVNDSLDFTPTLDVGSAFNVDYADGDMTIGAPAIDELYKGDMAEMWFTPSFIDFSITANRRLFISGTGHPVDLGSAGQTPTGSTPIIYESVRGGGVANDFLVNKGSGGAFTTAAGALTLSGTNP